MPENAFFFKWVFSEPPDEIKNKINVTFNLYQICNIQFIPLQMLCDLFIFLGRKNQTDDAEMSKITKTNVWNMTHLNNLIYIWSF